MTLEEEKLNTLIDERVQVLLHKKMEPILRSFKGIDDCLNNILCFAEGYYKDKEDNLPRHLKRHMDAFEKAVADLESSQVPSKIAS
ncbi:hypothetical protein [uncultured Bilophila sp.]|uniref:hypothetical protein n=1 Tax=uncultured Bilophila sp. TaxID=529385 RepID=UPI00280B0E2F|nr:hypothetical protein [uncultured Bilophila sp.]